MKQQCKSKCRIIAILLVVLSILSGCELDGSNPSIHTPAVTMPLIQPVPNTEQTNPTSLPTVPPETNVPSLPAHTHTYFIVEEIASTCNEKGAITYGCECGAQYTETVDTIDHTPGTPSCTSAMKCTSCGEILKEAVGHQFVETCTDATCTTAGYITTRCSVCGEEAVQDIPALGHNYGEWVISQTASCTRNGKAERLCSRCGVKEIQDIAKTDHNWGDWVTVTEPTTESSGSKKRVCNLCQKTEEQVIEKLPVPLYSPFDGELNVYIAENVPYYLFKTEEHWAAQITYYTTEKNDMIETEIVAEFEKAFGYAPKAQVSVSTVGKFYIDGIDGVKVYEYKIWDNSVPLVDNELMVVYDQICSDGVSRWTGFCFLGSTLDDYEAFAQTEEFAKLSAEMYARFEEATGQTLSYMRQHRDQYALGWISIAGTCRTADGQIMSLLYVYCREITR